jgi:high-affinity nickel-transport protein
MRHATDADHVVAVTTLVSQERSVRRAGMIGAVWGLGHTLTLVLVGGAIVLFGIVIPARVGLAMELAVAMMLVLLGGLNLTGVLRRAEALAHGKHPDPAAPPGSVLRFGRSFLVGLLHGLSGSAAVALLVLTTVRDPRWALLYLAIFGGGTVVGMMLLTSMIAVPFALAADRFSGLNRGLATVTSLLSIGLGLVLAYQVSVTDGLFLAVPHWVPGRTPRAEPRPWPPPSSALRVP